MFSDQFQSWQSPQEIISNEFAHLNFCCPFPSTCFSDRLRDYPSATSFENMMKNRYNIVLPKEETRVKLNNSKSDYINANFVNGPNGCPTNFICTQAPLESTCQDFWRMVWDQESHLIVMLTRLEENQQVKSCLYWPLQMNEQQSYGDFGVTLVSSVILGNTEYKVIEIQHQETVRRVYHLQYLGWPDQDVPKNRQEVVDLVNATSELQKIINSSKPVIVHCSAGVGRTGTFVSLYQYLESREIGNQNPSVFEIVKNIRRQRDSMVQTLNQYYLIYQILSEMNTKHKKEPENFPSERIISKIFSVVVIRA